jgi:hypothetical protein
MKKIKTDKICFSKTLFYMGCILLLLMGYLIIDKLTIYLKDEKKQDIKIDEVKDKVTEKVKDRLVIVDRPIDTDSPPQYKRGPDRNYTMGGGLPINIRTRGEPNEYQNIGLLKNASDSSDVKPLYGRRIFRGSNMWNYYTVLNDHIQVKLPILRTNNCLDERGCSEIQSGEEITVTGMLYKVELYPYSDFRYIPY